MSDPFTFSLGQFYILHSAGDWATGPLTQAVAWPNQFLKRLARRSCYCQPLLLREQWVMAYNQEMMDIFLLSFMQHRPRRGSNVLLYSASRSDSWVALEMMYPWQILSTAPSHSPPCRGSSRAPPDWALLAFSIRSKSQGPTSP